MAAAQPASGEAGWAGRTRSSAGAGSAERAPQVVVGVQTGGQRELYDHGDPRDTYASWGKALDLPAVRGLVVGRALLYPPDGDVAAAVEAGGTASDAG